MNEIHDQDGGGKSWNEFAHNGVIFPGEYFYHQVPILIKSSNRNLVLNPVAEEMANFYAMASQTDQIKSSKFIKNFWESWQQVLTKNEIEQIRNIKNVDFSQIFNYLEFMRQTPLNANEKEIKANLSEKIDSQYKNMIVDGQVQPVGNYRVEPPGIFIGRGCNPRMGKVKNRIYPEDISINISEEGKIPIPPNNRSWNTVLHKPDVWWLASWKEPITGKIKSVRLANSSEFKAESDQLKFDLARKLKRRVSKIRNENEKLLNSDNMRERQLAVALSIIDELALRVGNEKGKDDTDTVGVSSLRVEHLSFFPHNKIKLDFLGKDSIRFLKEFQVTTRIYNNLQMFVKNKKSSDAIFDKIKSKDINDYLRSYMTGLTSKVFRTMNASVLYQTELKKASRKFPEGKIPEQTNIILDAMKEANRHVAILCNHQKAVSKNFQERLEKINEQIKNQELKIKLQKRKIKELSNSKSKTSTKENKANYHKKMEVYQLKLQDYKLKLELLQRKKESVINLKSISLDTSRTNYIDPRISFAFSKKYHLDPALFFSTTLLQRFEWAQNVDSDWKF